MSSSRQSNYTRVQVHYEILPEAGKPEIYRYAWLDWNQDNKKLERFVYPGDTRFQYRLSGTEG